MKKINKSELMTNAHIIRKNLNITMSEALKKSWAKLKEACATIEDGLSSARLLVKKVGDLFELTITNVDFNFTLKRIKSFEKRSYDSASKKWLVPVSNSYQLENFLRNF